MSVRIREYEESDRAAVLELADRLTVGVAPWRDPARVASAVRGWVESSVDGRDANAEVFVAQDGDVIVGFATISQQTHWSGEEDGYLGELAVRADQEGHGIGRALVAAAEDWARARRLARVRVATGAANVGALSLYERLGYEREDVTLSRDLTAGR